MYKVCNKHDIFVVQLLKSLSCVYTEVYYNLLQMSDFYQLYKHVVQIVEKFIKKVCNQKTLMCILLSI